MNSKQYLNGRIRRMLDLQPIANAYQMTPDEYEELKRRVRAYCERYPDVPLSYVTLVARTIGKNIGYYLNHPEIQ